MSVLNATPTLYTAEKANLLAVELTSNDDDGWTYKAVHLHDGKGSSQVIVYDDND